MRSLLIKAMVALLTSSSGVFLLTVAAEAGRSGG